MPGPVPDLRVGSSRIGQGFSPVISEVSGCLNSH